LSDVLKDKLDTLFRLQDLDMMIREVQDPELRSKEEAMGFTVSTLDKLMTARARLLERIDPQDLRLYERIVRRHAHAIVPVADRTCLGCHMALPTSAASRRMSADALRVCESCGRILYWLE
jgi:predicted  nucleic acid-binding Zn-ribbon protein